MNYLSALLGVIACLTPVVPATAREVPPITKPTDAVLSRFRDRDREAAQAFYQKSLDVHGLSVLAGGDVADEALHRTADIVGHLLAGRPDILGAMADHGTRLIIIGKDQVYTDMPEYRDHPDPQYQNERVRGTGGLDVTSFGEENLLNLAGDRYDDESIGLHEFCHTIDAALGQIDPLWRERLRQTYRDALARGLWKDAYAGSNPGEYWAEICQSYFNCNRVDNWNHNAIGSREQLKRYDPAGYDLVRTTFRLAPSQDWTLTPLKTQPSVVAPPARFHVNPYYTKFTYAREFPVIGSARVDDSAMLRANDLVRKLFAYRHDILKALIADGARLVVLARGETLNDLPELKKDTDPSGFDGVRYLDYNPTTKIMVVPEENLLGLPTDPLAGQCLTLGAFAKAFYQVTAQRPVDPEFDHRRQRQQYELRVRRLDVEFGREVQAAFDDAATKGLWVGTPAARDLAEYWATGVAAYFDGADANVCPAGADRPVATREALKTHDPGLYALVDRTMAYRGHPDWRARP